jgi:hypothetical protein
MSEPLYRIDGARAYPSLETAGPWDPTTQHGGAPAGLFMWALEAQPAAAPMLITRFTMDLFRPAPIAPLDLETEIVREGRNIQALGARLLHNGKEVARATAVKVRAAAFEVPAEARMHGRHWPDPDECLPFTQFNQTPFVGSLEIRTAREPQPGGDLREGRAAWFRVKRPFLEGAETTPAVRTAMCADFINGLSSVLDFSRWIFINADLTVHFVRAPVGEWMLVDARTWVGPDGRGLAFAEIFDLSGPFGRATQSLVIAPR